MNKYNEVEIQTAKNLLKEGYKWIDKKYSGTLYAYKNNPGEAYAPGNTAKIICSSYVPIFESINIEDAPTSLGSIAYPQILDDAEKRYLRDVIRPFRDKVLRVKKCPITNSKKEYLVIDTGPLMFFLLLKPTPCTKEWTCAKNTRLRSWGYDKYRRLRG